MHATVLEEDWLYVFNYKRFFQLSYWHCVTLVKFAKNIKYYLFLKTATKQKLYNKYAQKVPNLDLVPAF
jgi:abortive infection bacteriophage resistance protein